MKTVFVFGVRDIVLAVIVAVALGLMFYGYVEYKMKLWHKKRIERLKQKLVKK